MNITNKKLGFKKSKKKPELITSNLLDFSHEKNPW